MNEKDELELLELEAEAARKKNAALPPQGRSVLGRSNAMESFRDGGFDKSEPPGFIEQATGGIRHSLNRAGQGLAGLFGQTLVTPDRLAAGKAFVDETGPTSSVAQFAGDAGMAVAGGSPILKGANLLKQAMMARGIGGAGSAAVGADIAGNAGAAAALSPEDRGTAAAFGAGGAAGGRVLARTLGGPLKPLVSPEAKTLLNDGAQLTPGQLVSGADAGFTGKTVRNFEDSMQSFPIVGDVIRHGRAESSRSWNLSEINQALVPIGARVSKGGRAGIEAAEDAVSQTYTKVLPDIYIPQASGDRVIKGIVKRAEDGNPLFDIGHENKLSLFIDRRIKPVIDAGEVSGPVAKKLDAELGELARKYRAGGIGNEPLGDAFDMLRQDWRGAMEGLTPEATEVLQNANTAFAKLLPMKAASAETNSGFVTPGQLRRATNKLGHTPTDSSLAARSILPDSIPDSGTAGRLALHDLITPRSVTSTAAAGAMGGLGVPAALAAAAAGMYTKTGAKYLSSGGEDILNAVLKKLRQGPMTPANLNQLEEVTRLLGSTGTKAYGNIGE